MAHKTTVIYNGVYLSGAMTREWSQEAVYDPSNTDLIGQRYTVAFECLVHVQNLDGAPQWVAEQGPITRSNMASQLKAVGRLLMQPRRELTVRFGETDVLHVTAPANYSDVSPDVDVDNGPKPLDVKVSHVVADKVARITFRVSAMLAGCEKEGGSAGMVLNNRWSIGESMDDNFVTTKTIRGQIRLKVGQYKAHAFKGLVVPGLEAGFARKRVTFEALPNGLEATYEVVDKQVHTAAPWPATKISGSHIETTADGFRVRATCNVRLEGPPGVDKRLLFSRAVAVMDSRLELSGHRYGSDYVFEHAALIDHIGEANAVELQCTILRGPEEPGGAIDFVGIRKKIGSPLALPPMAVSEDAGDDVEYDPRLSPLPYVYGSTSHTSGPRDPVTLFMQHCFLQQPCGGPRWISQATQGAEEAEGDGRSGRYDATLTGYQVHELQPAELSYVSEEAREALYTLCTAETTYVVKPMRTQMPIAAITGANASSEKPRKDSPADQCSVCFDLGRPQCHRIIRVEAERVGQWPAIPKPEGQYSDGSLTGTLLEYWDRELPRTVTPDGAQYMYHIEAYYRYGLNRPPRHDEKTRIGVLPITIDSQDDTALVRSEIYDERLAP